MQSMILSRNNTGNKLYRFSKFEKHLFSEGVVRHWHGLPGELVELLSMEALKKKRVDVTLSDTVQWVWWG